MKVRGGGLATVKSSLRERGGASGGSKQELNELLPESRRLHMATHHSC